MSIVERVLAARQEIPTIAADKTAKLGTFTFKYASLEELLDVVIPVLSKHKVLLTQKLASGIDTNLIGVWTELSTDGEQGIESITSGPIYARYDGTPRNMGSVATSVKRIQLVAILGLAVSDGNDAPQAPYQRTQQVPPKMPLPSREEKRVVLAGGDEEKWASQEPYRKAVQRSNAGGGSIPLQTLKMRLQQAEKAGGSPMSIHVAEGKKVSQYGYLASKVDEVTLSYLYGRVITDETPPLMATKFFLDELIDGKHGDEIAEAKRIAAA